jgi:hypothetical protein
MEAQGNSSACPLVSCDFYKVHRRPPNRARKLGKAGAVEELSSETDETQSLGSIETPSTALSFGLRLGPSSGALSVHMK